MSYIIHTKVPWEQTMRELRDTMRLWEVDDWDVHKPSERSSTVMLKYVKNGRTVTLPMSNQPDTKSNLRVLYLAVDAMRLNEKRGLGEVIQQAYLQLAAPEQPIDPYELLGIRPDTDLEIAEAVFRTMARKYHPDAKPSGNAEKFKQLNDAIEQIRKERQV